VRQRCRHLCDIPLSDPAETLKEAFWLASAAGCCRYC
jgi:hypothetical protein